MSRISLAPGPDQLMEDGAVITLRIYGGAIDSEPYDARAVIDTGAFELSLKTEIADELGLPVTGHEQVAGANAAETVDVRQARIEIPDLDWIKTQQVVCLALPGDIDALIGRDVLRHFHLTWDGPNGIVVIDNPETETPDG